MSRQSNKEEPGRDSAVRERLLREALTLFNAKGYAATSVREIVAAAGVSKPTLYYYFASKEGIYLELMTATLATFEATVAELVIPRGSARQRLLRFATGLFDIFQENIEVVRLIFAIHFGPSQGTPNFRQQVFFDQMLSVAAGMLEEGISSGQFRPVAVGDAAWALISCLNTMMEEHLTNPTPRLDRAALERTLGMILDGIALKAEEGKVA